MFQMLFSMEGRISRSQYWLLWVIQTILGAGLFYVGLTATQPSFAWTSLGLEAVVFWMMMCRIGKRLHDRGKSAWYTLGVFVPFLGMAWELFACGFMAGDAHDNAYGPAPGRGSETAQGEGQLAKLDDEYFRKMADDLRSQHKNMEALAAAPSAVLVPPQNKPASFGKRRS